jgi:hypothetical protein
MSDVRPTELRTELRALQGARTRLEAATKRKPPARRGQSRVDKLVQLLATQPRRNWFIEEMVEGLPGIPGGRAKLADRERAVRAAIGQTQQRGLIENTGRRRYRLTAAGRSLTAEGASSNGSGTSHLAHAIAALKKEEQAVAEALRKAEQSIASARRASRAASKRVQPGEHGTQLDQLMAAMVVKRDQEWSIDDMLRALVAKGWKTSSEYPEQIVRNNITHALALGLVRRTGRGRYRIRPEGQKAAGGGTRTAANRRSSGRAARSTSRGRATAGRRPAVRTTTARRRGRAASKR